MMTGVPGELSLGGSSLSYHGSQVVPLMQTKKSMPNSPTFLTMGTAPPMPMPRTIPMTRTPPPPPSPKTKHLPVQISAHRPGHEPKFPCGSSGSQRYTRVTPVPVSNSFLLNAPSAYIQGIPVRRVGHMRPSYTPQPPIRTSLFSHISAAASISPAEEKSSRTKEIMESLPMVEGEVGGAGGAFTYESLLQRDSAWTKLRNMATGPAPKFVKSSAGQKWEKGVSGDDAESVKSEGVYDVAVCGGTLGIFVAAALAKGGARVIVIEGGTLQGRAQEWNISRKELEELVHLGILEEEELKEMISVEFNPNRCGFKGGEDVWVTDILNLGVSPKKLIQRMKERFLEWGGAVLEQTRMQGVDVYDNAAILSVSGRPPIAARLVVDAMGNFSPIVQQIRWGVKPDGVCLVVGGCARGFPEDSNKASDVIYTDSDLAMIGNSPCQLFWEAFPAGSGPTDRTTYLFTYIDAESGRPSLEELMDEYWERMPVYQGVSLDQLQFLRVLFGFFPTYRDSPLQTPFDRVIQVGDASGIQSPLSFGGFGAITRHLRRISQALLQALDADMLSKETLALVNPYQPNLSGGWLLQRAMAPPLGSNPPPPAFINNLLSSNFASMQRLGDPVLRPFLQDVTQFSPLALTMGSMVLTSPALLPDIFKLVGIPAILDWLLHFISLGTYTAASSALAPLLKDYVAALPQPQRFEWERRLEAWEYGSGLDYKL